MPEPLPELQAASPASPLNADQLYRRCELEELPFNSTEELEPLAEHLGQDRAVEALEFGLQIPHDGYNIFLLGSTGVGKQDLLASLLNKDSAEPLGEVSDWCYVNNFQQPYKPHVLELPPGIGHELSTDMEQLIEDLHSAIPAVFESEEYRTRSQVIEEELSEKQERTIDEIRTAAREKGISKYLKKLPLPNVLSFLRR